MTYLSLSLPHHADSFWPTTKMYKIFHIYLVYARHCFSLRFTNSRGENLCQKRQRAQEDRDRDSAEEREERFRPSFFPGQHRLSMSVCVCVFFVLYSTGKLPMYVMQFCCSLTALDFSTAPDSFALSFAHHLPSLSPGLQLNLKFLHNPTKLGAKI